MLPNRIERQLAFLAAHPGVKVFASRAHYIDQDGRIFGLTKCEPFTTPARFAARMAAGRPIGINHSSAMLHRPTILAVGGYRSAHEPAEDIDLWNRLAEQGHMILQQEEVLTQYRIHGNSLLTSRTRQGWEVGDWTIACMLSWRAWPARTMSSTASPRSSSYPGWRREAAIRSRSPRPAERPQLPMKQRITTATARHCTLRSRRQPRCRRPTTGQRSCGRVQQPDGALRDRVARDRSEPESPDGSGQTSAGRHGWMAETPLGRSNP
jgi:hypothetical protein